MASFVQQSPISFSAAKTSIRVTTNYLYFSRIWIMTGIKQIDPYRYIKSKHEASSAQFFAPSASKSTSDNGSNSEELRRKKSHNEIEKKYRSSLNDHFIELQDVLGDSRTLENKLDEASTQITKRASRINVLAHDREEILALRDQVGTLEEKLESLRKFAFPATCKYTLRNS